MAFAKLSSKDIPQNCFHIAFLLQPNFTMLALSSAIEPLRMANQLSGETLYKWTIVSEDGRAVHASDGLTVEVDSCITSGVSYDSLSCCFRGYLYR